MSVLTCSIVAGNEPKRAVIAHGMTFGQPKQTSGDSCENMIGLAMIGVSTTISSS